MQEKASSEISVMPNDGLLRQNLDHLKYRVKADWDCVVIVDGVEGSGKSCLASQCAFYLDQAFNLDSVVFRPEAFHNSLLSLPKYRAIVYDEAYGGLGSRASMSNVNRGIIKLLTECRQRNLFIFIVLPSFFILDRYAALFRSIALLHVYAPKGQRGRFAAFNQERKQSLYLAGYKTYSYGAVKANFIGHFANVFPFDKEEYVKKKIAETAKIDTDKGLTTSTLAMRMSEKGIENEKIADILSITVRQVRNLISGKTPVGKKYMDDTEQSRVLIMP